MQNTGKLKKTVKNKIIFLDRDGVINWDPIGDYIKHPDDFKFLPGVAEALHKLTLANYQIVVISNQAGVGDGVFSRENLEAVNKRFLEQVAKVGSKISGIFYCLHGKQAGCECRKPETGLFEQASEKIGSYERGNTYYIGDKASDIVAGKRFGLKTIFVLSGHGQNEMPNLKKEHYPDHISDNLGEAITYLLSRAA